MLAHKPSVNKKLENLKMKRMGRKRISLKLLLRSHVRASKRSKSIDFDPEFLEELERKSNEYGLSWDENMPMTENHLRLMDGLEPLEPPVDNKKKERIKKIPLRPGGDRKSINMCQIHRVHPNPKPDGLRQTTIDEYFKPKRLSSANLESSQFNNM